MERVLNEKARKIPVLSILLFMLFVNTLALAVEVCAFNELWEYGASKRGFGYSNYFHSSNLHHSSVVNPKNDNSARGSGKAGEWSKARYYKVPPTGLEYYYGFD